MPYILTIKLVVRRTLFPKKHFTKDQVLISRYFGKFKPNTDPDPKLFGSYSAPEPDPNGIEMQDMGVVYLNFNITNNLSL